MLVASMNIVVGSLCVFGLDGSSNALSLCMGEILMPAL